MIVNVEERFVFVHIPKTAGTSVRAALGALPGNAEFITSNSTKHETYNQFMNKFKIRKCLSAPRNIILGRPFPSYNEIKDYNVLAVIREPCDRIQSLYRYLKKIKHRSVGRCESFESFWDEVRLGRLNSNDLYSLKSQSEYIKGVPEENRILISYDSIVECSEIYDPRIPVRVSLPKLNVTKGDGVEIPVSREIRKEIEEIYRDDKRLYEQVLGI